MSTKKSNGGKRPRRGHYMRNNAARHLHEFRKAKRRLKRAVQSPQ